MNITTHLPYLPIISLFGLITLATACSKPPETPTPTPAPDMTSDQTPDLSDTPDATPDTSCTPNTCESLGNVCGMVDDGCGNTLDCGACACVDKKPTTPDCGPCQLGTASCDENNALACDFPDIPEVTDQIDCTTNFYYVSNLKDQQGDGTKDNPFNTLTAALEAAKTADPRPLAILVQGNKPYTVQLDVINGVSIIGGFSDRWRYNKDLRSKITSPNTGGDVFGLTARDINTPTLVSNLTISNDDAVDGHHNYGATIIDAPKLIITNSFFQAGKGGNGANGTDGTKGADGVDGEDGYFGCATPEVIPLPVWIPVGSIAIYCSDGGKTTVNPSCPDDSKGGQGGDGGKFSKRSMFGSTITIPPTKGESGTGNTPGTGGLATTDGNDALEHENNALNGQPGMAVGRVDPQTGRWTPAQTAYGENGANGLAGSGGGGGGGAKHEETILHIKPFFTPGGGSGGSGGCGGTGGTGGYPGGTSIGVVIINSNGLSLSKASFLASEGGLGGASGLGGTGGAGGKGGEMGDKIVLEEECVSIGDHSLSCSPKVSRAALTTAGNGGNGVKGQAGGHGGGGAGGNSIGAYCIGTTLTQSTSIEFVAENGGSGTGDQAKGQTGQSLKTFGCLLP